MVKPVNVRDLKNFEGKRLKFLGDDSSAIREGIITDIVIDNDAPNNEPRAAVIWDTDELVAYENGQKIVCFDSGVSTYPITSILNTKRFQIFT